MKINLALYAKRNKNKFEKKNLRDFRKSRKKTVEKTRKKNYFENRQICLSHAIPQHASFNSVLFHSSTDVEPKFPYRDVTIKRGVDAKEYYELLEEIGR